MINRIGVIFDFDETLAPDSTSCFLESLGLDVQEFWEKEVNPLYQKQGWDPIPAYLYKMIEFSNKSSSSDRITQDKLKEFGRKIKFFNGVQNIFRQLEQSAREVNPTVQVDFFLISSGIREILINTKIAKYFKDIWACDFHYNNKREIVFPKNVLSFTDKTRYLFQISKGIFGPESRSNPFEVNAKVSELYIPFNQMIIIGDGFTDVPLFSLISKHGGTAIAVYSSEDKRKWPKAWGFVEDKRVRSLCSADYGKKSTLNHILNMAVANIASNLQIAPTVYQR